MNALPTFDIEDSVCRTGSCIAGIDEAGRGPWAGPVVAAAVVLDRHNLPGGLQDSKKMSPRKRENVARHIRATAVTGVGISSVQEIDSLNILQAALLAMARAEKDLGIRVDTCLVDGLQAPALSARVITVVKGDMKSLSIAAASVIAKTVRDDIMCRLSATCPGYAWDRNKGYGTPAHRAGLRRYGITQHHRKSFAPVRNMLCQSLSDRDAGSPSGPVRTPPESP